MRKFIFDLAHEMRVIFRFGRKRVKDTDRIIAENADLIKQIRMHRMKFYRHYKRSSH